MVCASMVGGGGSEYTRNRHLPVLIRWKPPVGSGPGPGASILKSKPDAGITAAGTLARISEARKIRMASVSAWPDRASRRTRTMESVGLRDFGAGSRVFPDAALPECARLSRILQQRRPNLGSASRQRPGLAAPPGSFRHAVRLSRFEALRRAAGGSAARTSPDPTEARREPAFSRFTRRAIVDSR